MSRFLAGCSLLSAWLLCPLCCSAQTESSVTSYIPPGNCGPGQFLDTETFQCSPCGEPLVKSLEGLSCVCVDSLNTTDRASECSACSSRQPTSLWESTFLDGSFLACNNSCNRAACERLTNMVILNAFSLETRAYDLYTKAKSQNLPKLFYSNTGLPPLSFGKNATIHLKVVKYDAQGNFLGWEDVTGGTLQLCADRQSALDAAYSFGTSYEQSCTVPVSSLLRRVPKPVFYEMFLEFSNEKGNSQLWPVPVVNPQSQLSSPASLRSQALRRFFLVDGLSGRRANLSNQPASVTLAAGLLLSVDLPTSSPGDQPTFLLTVKYAKQDSAAITQIALAILGSLAALYALLKTSSWGRRSRLQTIGLIILVKFFAFFAGALANVFFMVTLGTGIYWLIVFKGQQSSAVEVTLPPAGSQIETNFIIYLSCAFVLKAVDLLHLLITQLSISIFLIDWEKPKEKPAFKAPTGQRATSSVSIWRTFLIANEWNEIQTHRKLKPSLQLFAVLLLLEVVGLKNIASRDLNLDLHPGADAYRAAWSPILRFGIAASLWLALAIVQAYRDMDFMVKDKFFLERIMDMEFQEPVDMSILYTDDRALFSRTLFYNNELALLLFDTLLFSVVDLGTQDFVLAAIVTFVVQKLVEKLRQALGRRNLAAKTLVEKQFLI